MSDKFDELEEEVKLSEDNKIDDDNSDTVKDIMRKTEMSNEVPIYIEDEIKASYLDYSMSVIVSRALPDVRDGLKPVHRRILYAMNELGMEYSKPHKKSARIVGEVLGKYHPHGDSSVYNAMVRMAQGFNTRYELVDGQGNFGSIDGDSAAAMRYTEARMSKITSELLSDIDKNTIDFRKNFDESLDEPVVLPAKLPNLLLNGTTGIAVGMATNIPPHNLIEIADAIIALIDNKEISIDELIKYVKGPDFPTGGTIYGKGGIISAYKTGRGKVRVAGTTHIEKDKKGRESIIITELPYQVNKSRLVEKIADLVKEKKISGISDLRDESGRNGIRVVIELKKGEESELVLNNLFKYTELQTTFGIIMLALVNNAPKILNLKEVLQNYLKHRFEVITRRTEFLLNKDRNEAHRLEGLLKALDHIDEVIKMIRASKTPDEAAKSLMERFEFTKIQAAAILAMTLQRLTGLERAKLEDRYDVLSKNIANYEDILANDYRKYEIIKEEVSELKDKFGDKRRTSIENERFEIGLEDLIKNEDVIVTITKKGYVKRMSLDTYKSQKRGGLGVSSATTIEDDILKDIYAAKTLDRLMIFTDKGKVYSTKVYEISESSKQARGKLISNIIDLDENEKVSVIIPVNELENDTRDLVFITKNGIAKKTKLEDFKNINKNGKRALSFKNDEDEVKFVGITSGSQKDEIFIATKKGMAIRFSEDNIRAMGRSAAGVKAIKLDKNDEVVSADIIDITHDITDLTVLSITSNGFGKRTYIDEFTLQNRGGKGLKNYKLTEDNNVVHATLIKPGESEDMDIMAISSSGVVIRCAVNSFSIIGRATKGVKVQRLKYGEYLVSADKVRAEIKEEIEESE